MRGGQVGRMRRCGLFCGWARQRGDRGLRAGRLVGGLKMADASIYLHVRLDPACADLAWSCFPAIGT